jgi:hypothetical protein
MVAQNARKALEDENKLLDELAQKAASTPAGATWADFFRGFRETNEKLMSMADAAFDQELNEEIKRLEGMRNSITGDSAGAKFHRDDLAADIKNAKELL